MKDTRKLTSMPDPLAPDHEKRTNEYGLKVCQAMQDEWFNGGMVRRGTPFVGRNLWVNKMRLYNRGEQDIKKYKNFVARQQNDLSFLNLDWTPINIPEKFTYIVKNGISDDNYMLDIRSADRISLIERKDKVMKYKRDREAKPMLERAKALFGIDLVPKGYVPEDDVELELYMQVKERPKIEISEEILINHIKEINNWDFIKKQTDEDSVLTSLSIARHYTDKNDGVKVEYVDSENYGHSFVKKKDFSDAYYHFVVDTITLSDIKRESDYEDKELREIAKLCGTSENNTFYDYDTQPIDDLLDLRIHVMRFCYKTSKEIVYKKYHDKKNRVRKVASRNSEWEVPEGAENSRLSKRLDTWYEGNYIIGSNKYLYNYRESENLAKDKMNRVIPPFIVQSYGIYNNRLKSFLSNIVSLCDQMQYAHLKIQHLMAELKPDLIVLDLDQLAELDTNTKGAAKSKTWETALSILNVKGVVIQKRINMGEDGIKDGPGARPMASQQGSSLAALLNVWAHYYNLVREITGINPARDGSLPADSLVGVNQLMQLASNTVTKHIVDAAIAFDLRVSEAISSRIKSIFTSKDAKHIRELYEQAVGKQNIEALEPLKNRHLHEFGFTYRVLPTREELNELRQDLSIAVQEKTIDISEKQEILRIAKTNIKLAIEYMKMLRNRRIKEEMKRNEHNMRMQRQTNIESAQANAQSKVQAYGIQKQIDLDVESKLSEIRILEKQAMQQIEAPIKDKEFQQDVYLEQIKNAQVLDLAKYKEDAKDLRLEEQSSHQSKLIKQRQDNTEPIDFSEEKLEIPTILDY